MARSPRDYDESDVRVRPNRRGSRPRTKDRPAHADAVSGRVLAVDFGAIPTEGIGHVLCVLRLRTGWDHAERLGAMLRRAGFAAVETGPTGHRALAFVRGQKPVAGSTVGGVSSA